MTQEDKQAVVEQPQEPAQPATEEGGAPDERDPLSEFLAQYDEGVTDPQPQPEQKQEPKADEDLARRLSALEQQNATLQNARDMEGLVKAVRGDTEFGDDVLVEAWIDAEARRNPELEKVWQNRQSNRRAFEQMTKALGQQWAKRAKDMPDANVTEDRLAVAAAVRGASKKASPPEDDIDRTAVLSMTGAELEAWGREQAKKLGY